MPLIRQILGLDLSLNHTGWCSFTIGEPGSLEYGVHDQEKSQRSDIEKMDSILNWLEPRLLPDTAVLIEGFAFGARGNAVVQLAGLQYLVRHRMFKKAVPFKLVTPNQAKKFLTGKQHCDKNLIIKEVLKRYRIDVDDDNVADAINLNKIGQAFLGLIEIDNQAQREVVEELLHGRAAKKKRGKKPAPTTA